jgi:putative ABC transport system ATP-binding protein
VVLADEPTGNLDEASAGRVMDQLLEVVAERRCSLVLVTHNQAFAGRTDVGYRLEGGVLKPSWAGSDIPA